MNYSTEKAILSLQKRVEFATHLIICDPFILSISDDKAQQDYLTKIYTILPQNLKSLLLIYDSDKRHRLTIVEEIKKTVGQNVKIQTISCHEIHDRVWIIDGKQAFVTGTSLNGIGVKLYWSTKA